jgi:hypothetical protein
VTADAWSVEGVAFPPTSGLSGLRAAQGPERPCLIVDRRGDLVQLVGVLARVVRTEQQVVATGKLDAHVCLCSTAVTAVKSGELGAWCYGCRHVLPFFPEGLRMGKNIQPAMIIPSGPTPMFETLLRPYVARAR